MYAYMYSRLHTLSVVYMYCCTIESKWGEMAVTMPPAWLMAVATAPTTPWSGAVCRRMVIEYDVRFPDKLSADQVAGIQALL